MTIKQALRCGLAASAFAGFGLGGLLLSFVVLPLASCDPSRIRRQRRCQRIVRATFVLFHDYMRVCGLVAYDPRKAPRVLPDAPLVLVTNHPTLIDVTALIAAYGELCVVVKGPLYRGILFGPLLHLCGHIDGGSGGFGSSAQVVDQAVERLRHGHRVLMFPEGSRSPQGGLRRFHLGAFSAALQAGVPLIPLAISAEPPGLMKGQPFPGIPTTAIVIKLHPLQKVTPDAHGSPRELMQYVRSMIEQALAQAAQPRS